MLRETENTPEGIRSIVSVLTVLLCVIIPLFCPAFMMAVQSSEVQIMSILFLFNLPSYRIVPKYHIGYACMRQEEKTPGPTLHVNPTMKLAGSGGHNVAS